MENLFPIRYWINLPMKTNFLSMSGKLRKKKKMKEKSFVRFSEKNFGKALMFHLKGFSEEKKFRTFRESLHKDALVDLDEPSQLMISRTFKKSPEVVGKQIGVTVCFF